jgi:DNA-binding MarR family transcriptional regulator
MPKITQSLQFFLCIDKIHNVMSRRFDGRLGGLGFKEFIILFYLSQAGEEKMRRIDLAEKVGLTASGITRLLLPMEKVGYIKKETHETDARASYVILASGGKRKLSEAIERAEIFMEDIIPQAKVKKMEALSEELVELEKIL